MPVKVARLSLRSALFGILVPARPPRRRSRRSSATAWATRASLATADVTATTMTSPWVPGRSGTGFAGLVLAASGGVLGAGDTGMRPRYGLTDAFQIDRVRKKDGHHVSRALKVSWVRSVARSKAPHGSHIRSVFRFASTRAAASAAVIAIDSCIFLSASGLERIASATRDSRSIAFLSAPDGSSITNR